MPDLTIESGKFYKTRIGIKAIIYAIDRGGNKPIHGAIFNGTGWDIRAWDRLGGYSLEFTVNHKLDLVSPWIDAPVVIWEMLPPWISAVTLDEEGVETNWYCVPVFEKGQWRCPDKYHLPDMPSSCTTNLKVMKFSGDWRDSLAIRPGYEGIK